MTAVASVGPVLSTMARDDRSSPKGAAEMAMTLTSPAFVDGGIIPTQFTCDGDNLPPPLHWSTGPGGTLSFVLTMEDPDAPGGDFTHWVLFDIPAQDTQWPGDGSSKTLRNSFGNSGYGGPCPPAGDNPHRYILSIHAVDVRYLELAGESVPDLRAALAEHSIARGQLIGRYGRS